MALNAAEEETVEAIKKWWDENGKQLVLMIMVVMAGHLKRQGVVAGFGAGCWRWFCC